MINLHTYTNLQIVKIFIDYYFKTILVLPLNSRKIFFRFIGNEWDKFVIEPEFLYLCVLILINAHIPISAHSTCLKIKSMIMVNYITITDYSNKRPLPW